MRFEIHEIDPNYTLGDMALKLGKIRETLRVEGIFEANRNLPLPIDFQRIVVISPEGRRRPGGIFAPSQISWPASSSLPVPLPHCPVSRAHS